MLKAPNLSAVDWLTHGFGQRDSVYPSPITTVKQIHSDTVAEAGDGVAEADGLVTQQPGVVVGVRTADCVPVLIVDTQQRAVAAVHAGWRGSARNIVAVAVRELISRYGTRLEDLSAAIGPSIGVCCYEVGSEVARLFQNSTPETNGRLDLAVINERQLREAGVQNVWMAGVCTFCEAQDYFSFRREREQAGRMTSFIGVI
ncbi:MAG: purine-nucleoside/S-methyl-5-thioadenosine phosphorylase / adenosine deaminase [Bryobacterales bacterium]|jgi:YfiH family protein|nr:purine-nucleoside/S-methyl-5-thioadenosine phosphorylase / adenosine deaminase [Bryobacterales bacterium]